MPKWILRMLGSKHGVDISFAPEITVSKAGNMIQDAFKASARFGGYKNNSRLIPGWVMHYKNLF
ncbi:MAG: hypothetical protein ACP5D9_04920 [Mariniphaga sp.]